MTAERTLSKIHLKAIRRSLNEFFETLKKTREEEKRFKKRFYSTMKEEVEHLMSFYLLNQEKVEEELQRDVKEIQDLWEEIEKEIMGVVIIVTRDPLYFWKKHSMWKKKRTLLLAEDIEEAILLSRKMKLLDPHPDGKPVNAIVLDPSVVERFDDLQRLKEIMENEKIVEEILVE